jgi:hypothetical protein
MKTVMGDRVLPRMNHHYLSAASSSISRVGFTCFRWKEPTKCDSFSYNRYSSTNNNNNNNNKKKKKKKKKKL